MKHYRPNSVRWGDDQVGSSQAMRLIGPVITEWQDWLIISPEESVFDTAITKTMKGFRDDMR